MFTWLNGLPAFFTEDSGGGGGSAGGKMVPEADLLAVKRGAEKEVSDLKAELSSLKSQVDAKHQESTSERAKREDVEKQIAILQGQVKEVEDLRSRLAASEKSRGESEQSLLDTRKQRLIDIYGLKAEDVKDYTKDQLALAEQVLSKAPRARGSYDRGGGGSNDNRPVSSRDLIRQGLDERR